MRPNLIHELGKGAVAGLVGTAAITLSMYVERRIRRAPPNTLAAKAVQKAFKLEPTATYSGERHLAQAVSWGYGTLWGLARGLLGALRVGGVPATAAHFGAVSGAAMTLLPAIGMLPPPWKLPPREIASFALHHLIYAGVAGATYELLENRLR
jgi:hypothetical protein